jgi:hypothetical protein
LPYEPVALERSEVRADPVIREVKRSGELLDRAVSATQQRDYLPPRALEKSLIPVRSNAPVLCWLFFLTLVAEGYFIKQNK